MRRIHRNRYSNGLTKEQKRWDVRRGQEKSVARTDSRFIINVRAVVTPVHNHSLPD